MALDFGLPALDWRFVALDFGLLLPDLWLVALDFGLPALDWWFVALDFGLLLPDLWLVALDFGLVALDLRFVVGGARFSGAGLMVRGWWRSIFRCWIDGSWLVALDFPVLD